MERVYQWIMPQRLIGMQHEGCLHGWHDIAKFFNVTEGAVQEWARSQGLPVKQVRPVKWTTRPVKLPLALTSTPWTLKIPWRKRSRKAIVFLWTSDAQQWTESRTQPARRRW